MHQARASVRSVPIADATWAVSRPRIRAQREIAAADGSWAWAPAISATTRTRSLARAGLER